MNIRVLHAGFGTDEGCTLKLVGCPHSLFCKQPLRANDGFGKDIPVTVECYRLAGGHLDINLQVVLQIAPHTGAVRDNVYSVLCQMCGRTDAR